MRRSFDVIVAELEMVDCGSLEVLLYCPDDLAAGLADETVEANH